MITGLIVAAAVAAAVLIGWSLRNLGDRLRQTERDVTKLQLDMDDNAAAVDTLLEQRRRQLAGKQAE